jgi:hypothetical protein
VHGIREESPASDEEGIAGAPPRPHLLNGLSAWLKAT